jgi:hypothetical protein
MAIQTRNIYITGNAEIDRILNDMAARLDVLEGLRPDLSSGYVKIDADKGVTTSDIEADFQPIVDGVSITDNLIALTSSTITLSGVVISDQSIAVTSGVIKNNRGRFEVYDPAGTLIHKME